MDNDAHCRSVQLKAAAFDALMENDDLGLAVLDRNLNYISINETLACFNGTSADEHIGNSVRQMLPDLAPQIEPMLQQVLDSGKGNLNFTISGETPSISGQASVWLGSYIPVFEPDSPNTVSAVLVMAENMTLKSQLERAKQQAAELVRRVLDGLFSFVGVLELDGTLIDANRPPLEAAGISEADVIGKKFWECPWWSHDQSVQQQLQQSIERCRSGETLRYEVEIAVRDGGRMLIDFMLAPLLDDHGVVTHLIPSAIDISSRAESERNLKESEERFRRVVDSSADSLLLVAEDGSVQLANARAGEMFGYEHNDLMGLKVEQLIAPQQAHGHAQLRADYLKLPKKRSMAARSELLARRSNGELFPVEVGLTPMELGGRSVTLATVMDISAQKAIQQDLMRALDEKTSLLNEVHHRVKNNLQVVSSLLSLQTRQVPEQLRSHFQESQDRIRAMALIHQLLYEQKHFDQVDTVAYVGRLLDLVKRSYLSGARGIQIEVHHENREINIPLDIAQPFGLFMNEVVTNAVKHAFENGEGRLTIELQQQALQLIVRVTDDGIGLPDGVVPGRGGSLGFQLINSLVMQMGAQLALPNVEVGTCFELKLDLQRSSGGHGHGS